MHQRVLVERSVNAHSRIVASIETLCELYGLDAGLAAALQPGSNNPAVRAMMEREAIADALDAITAAAQTPADKPSRKAARKSE